jgi:hypothetical protein
VSEHFTQTIVADFEYEIEDGGLPNPLCMVAYVLDEHLRHVRTIRVWREELPTADVPRTLFWSNYSAKAVALIQAKGIPWTCRSGI